MFPFDLSRMIFKYFDKGVNVEYVGQVHATRNVTPLMIASKLSTPEVVSLLLKRGRTIDDFNINININFQL